MIKKYKYEYNFGDASATLEIDINKLDKEGCNILLQFFSWDYDVELCPYDELGRLYCLQAMEFATCNSHNIHGVINDFKQSEGFLEVNGSHGVTLVDVQGIDFTYLEIDNMLVKD